MDRLASLMQALRETFRVVDLSQEVIPGRLTLDGTYTWGVEPRKFEIRQFRAPGPHLMHWVEAETHIGTHVEVPAHLDDSDKSCSEMPIDAFWGEAIALRFDQGAWTQKGAKIMPEHLKDVRKGDIVLAHGPATGPRPSFSNEAGDFLQSLPIKMLGEQNVNVNHHIHTVFFKKEIPIIERVANLELLTKERFLFFGLPLRIKYLDSSWIRAIAFEPM